MSQLFARSVLVLALLFGLVFAVGAGVLYYYDAPISIAIIFAVVIVALQYVLGPYLIDWMFKICWTHPSEISPQFAEFLSELCRKRGIPVPKFGIIEDSNPNAFTYGHLPGDARLVVTRGVIQMLAEDEFNAVVAHEIGHIKHYDFIVMSVASLVPLMLYVLYVWTRERRQGGGYAVAVSIGAYIAYFISQYIVLFLSRVREYFADEHSAYSVDSANAISRALIKIAYGLAKVPQEDLDKQNDDKKKQKKTVFNPSRLMGSLGICNFGSATPMALYSTTTTGHFSTDKMLRAMQWDLWNPWARIFEIQSTHPLIARRVMAASQIAVRRGETPQLQPSHPPKDSYWSEFTMDLIFASLPYLGLLVALIGFSPAAIAMTHNASGGTSWLSVLGFGILLYSLGWMLRLAYSYNSNYRKAKVEDLVGEVAVSHIRCIPVEVEGQVIGRGIPGFFWSKDLVMQDDTGFITLIYRQPLRILEFIFGFGRAERLVGKRGVFKGWYRRGPAPYLELREARFEDGNSIKCHYFVWAWTLTVLGAFIGGYLMTMLR